MEKRDDTFRKEDIMLLAQITHTMKDIAEQLEYFYKKKNAGRVESAKRELLRLQSRIDELI